ncbi:hypothetical protein V8J82_14330 [Gymnodinialimonas sp. 2305UL16-5]|uniref:lipoyl protein ligase domain-containing protein n=1 Tax=Gymnodinialimonas mytili TaxID=3126503 RepID=UPI0030AEB64C
MNAVVGTLSGAEAFALEADMLDRVGSGARSHEIAIWQTERCLVVPQAFTRNPAFDAAAEQMGQGGWPVFTRCTGGDVTPQGTGTVNVSLAYRVPNGVTPDIKDHYRRLCAPVAQHLRGWGAEPEFLAIPHSFCDGAHNLSVGGRKMVGTAQRWRRIRDGSGAQMVFAHALILVRADLPGGIAATNRLYDLCDVAQRVDAAVHVNLADLAPKRDAKDFSIASYMAWLHRAYDADLMAYLRDDHS